MMPNVLDSSPHGEVAEADSHVPVGSLHTSKSAWPSQGRWVLLLLCAVFALGVLLRVQGMERYVLEQDELYTVQEATDLWATKLEPGIQARPLYYLMQHVLLDWFPATPTALRLPPLIFGLLGLVLTWLIAARVFGRIAGVSAAALVALSPWHIYASGMARYWSLLYAMSAASVYLLLRARERESPARYLAAAGAVLVGAVTHPSFMFPMVGVALGFHLVGDDGRLRFPLPNRRAWAYLWLPLLIVIGAGIVALEVTGHAGAVQNSTGRGLLATLRLVPGIIDWTTPSLTLAGGLGMLLLVFSPGTATRGRVGWMCLLGTLSTVVLLVIAARRTDVYADYAMAGLPLVCLGAAGLVQVAVDNARSRRGIVALVICALTAAGMLPSTVSHVMDGTRFDYRPIYREITRLDPGMLVVTWPVAVARYYAPELEVRDFQTNAATMDDYLAEHGAFWVVASVRPYGIAWDDTGALRAWLVRHCRLETAFERMRLDARRYRVELHRCGEAALAPSPAISA